ncbi:MULTISPECIES: carbonic anhydrase [Actinoplanes]|uniref:carbonic anhydrase n=1 Tax=Actinoplanes TaxID=1865 RepID=UPI000A6C0700|nr:MULTISPECIES: carbonic anhydrase [Actinoplanes]GLY08365.1 carbonic anhydrase [Actinoplanes sp. NBRC 101535]
MSNFKPHSVDAGADECPWARLQEGNTRWVEGRSTAEAHRSGARRAELQGSQSPFALVLGCSDSRVPAEILFDQGLGDLFVVRTAGHVVDAAVLGSVEYAVGVLGVSLIVVLGHDECGAVAAAGKIIDNAKVPPGYIRDVAERIAPNVLRARHAGADNPAAVTALHSAYTLEQVRQRSSMVDEAIRRGMVEAVSARYCFKTGKVQAVDPRTGEAETQHTRLPHVLAA